MSPRRIQCSTTVITEGRDLPEGVWDVFKLFLTTQARRDELFKAKNAGELNPHNLLSKMNLWWTMQILD
ncbi:predicted protein [Micromonas commoda]|uniref:Uncharacterized protein n=1 Tax=Micromonas commoda (strain RCC299 / NOUM17 / CCMP2709) TaxID=296587 RepID=C1FDJ5_MICCC|nr:predicted protein [Micromonas commoda]ACO68801.1 predicted protein [Micromonas commoda]|eukprot:XP_002507543.1 predicted protein [Micromonas commoda]